MAEYMTVVEIARAAGCTQDGVRSAIKRGTLRGTRVSGPGQARAEWHIPADHARQWVDAMIDRRRSQATKSELRSGSRGGEVTKRNNRLAARLLAVKRGERVQVSNTARVQARGLVRHHMAMRGMR